MIPGKVFFEAIDISEHFTKKYEVYLLMNGIFYDKIKPFQSKYLCLTGNDVLDLELGLRSLENERENDDIIAELRPLKDKRLTENVPTITKSIPSEYLKVTIPQAYKLVLESKTIDIKFHLNSQNNNEEIKIHFSFEPVSSFSRKKLGATLTSNKTALKSNSNFNATQERLNLYERRENNQETFGESSFMNSPELYFPERVDYPKGRSSRSRSPTASNQERRSLEREYDGRSGLSKTMENMRGYFREKLNEESNAITESVELKKIDRKFNYMPSDIIIEDESSSSHNYFNSLGKKEEVSPADKVQYKVDTMKRIIDPISHFNQGTNIEMLSDIMENNQTYTSRGNLIFEGSEQKITIEKNNEEIPKISGNEKNYQTEVNLRSFETASDHDTLESLAYQREKILGELFGKLGTRGKK